MRGVDRWFEPPGRQGPCRNPVFPRVPFCERIARRHIPVSAITLTFGLAGLLTGCAALEQAPLTYSSVNTLGLSVAAATPQQPGLDVTIGFKSADVAYTPVAVAKKCRENNSKDCSEIVPIKGTSKGLSHSSSSDAADAQRHEINKLLDEQKEKRTQLLKLQTGAASIPSVCPADAAQAESADAGDEVDAAATDPAPAIAISQDCLNARKDAADLVKNEDSLDQRITEITKLLPAMEQELGRLSLEEKTDSNLEDSYSVFGTFNGDAGANKEGGTLQLGKTFSTGVAAQRYSEGLKTAAATVAMKQCLDALTAMLTAGKITGDDMVKAGMSLCSKPAETSKP